MAIWTANTEYACNWQMEDDCAPCRDKFPWGDGEPSPEQAEIFQSCVDAAAEILYALSGRQFGLCEVAIRPCRKSCDPCGGSGMPWTPALFNGEWVNLRCPKCPSSGCSCPEICEVLLPSRVHSVTQVMIDGEVLPSSAYRVDNGRALVALDRPIPEEGALFLAYAFLDQASVVCVTEPATLVVGVSLGSDCYGPDEQGRLQLRFEGLGAAGVTADYSGPAQGIAVLAYPSADPNTAGEAFLFDDAVWQIGQTVASVGIEDFGQPGNDDASATITYLDGTVPTWNAPRNVSIQGDFSAQYRVATPERFCWPTCQDMTADPSKPNTWEVTYLRGKPVPKSGQRALAELACELCLACLGDSCCALPKRITNLVVEGGTLNMLDPMDFLDKGKTGLYAVDLFLLAVNPKGRARSAALVSPDSIGHRRTTWKG